MQGWSPGRYIRWTNVSVSGYREVYSGKQLMFFLSRMATKNLLCIKLVLPLLTTHSAWIILVVPEKCQAQLEKEMEQLPKLCRLLQGPGSCIKAAQEPGGSRGFAHTASLCLMLCCLCCCGNAGGNAAGSWRRAAPRAVRWALRDSGQLAQANSARKGNSVQGENSRRKFKMDPECICSITHYTCHISHRIIHTSVAHWRPGLRKISDSLEVFFFNHICEFLLYWIPKGQRLCCAGHMKLLVVRCPLAFLTIPQHNLAYEK